MKINKAYFTIFIGVISRSVKIPEKAKRDKMKKNS
jgi:hypothetical protein